MGLLLVSCLGSKSLRLLPSKNTLAAPLQKRCDYPNTGSLILLSVTHSSCRWLREGREPCVRAAFTSQLLVTYGYNPCAETRATVHILPSPETEGNESCRERSLAAEQYIDSAFTFGYLRVAYSRLRKPPLIGFHALFLAIQSIIL